MIKKIERLQKEILIIQNKIEDGTKRDTDEKESDHPNEGTPNYQVPYVNKPVTFSNSKLRKVMAVLSAFLI